MRRSAHCCARCRVATVIREATRRRNSAGGVTVAPGSVEEVASCPRPALTRPQGSFRTRFSLTIDGVEIAQFAQLATIRSEAAPDDLAGMLLKKLPGKRTPPTVTLRRGMTTDLQLWVWHEAARAAHGEARKNASLTMFDAAGEPVARYHLENAWPSKIEIGALTAGAGELLFETVTLTCEDIQRVAV